MIDQPRLLVPDEEVRIAMRAIGIGDECVEPDELRREIGRDVFTGGGGIEVEGAVEVAKSDIHAMAAAEDLLNLGVGLAASEGGQDLDDREIGRGKPDGCREQADDQLRDQDLRSLPGPRNFTTNNPPRSVSTTAGSEPPSRSGWRYRVAV